MQMQTIRTTGRLPSSLYCDLFYGNPGAAEFRSDHLRVWMQVDLYKNDVLVTDNIAAKFCLDYPGVEVLPESVSAAINGLIAGGQVEEIPEGYRLTPRGKSDVRAAQERYNRSRSEFLASISGHITASDIEELTPEEVKAIKACSEELVTRVMLAERDALEMLYETRVDLTFIANQSAARAAELTSCLKTRLPDSLASRVRELCRETLNAVALSTDRAKTYLHTLNRSVVSAFFLIKDPHHAENIRTIAASRKYYIDTNVYLAALYRSQPSYDIVRPLLSALRTYGAQLCILPETVSEIRRIEQHATDCVPRARGDRALAKYMVQDRKAIFTDYWQAQEKDPNLRFSTFADLHMNPDVQLHRLGIETLPVEFEDDEDFLSLIPTFRNALRGVKEDRGRIWRYEALNHDAHALLSVAKLQLRKTRDAWGSTTQFLSLDRSLGPAIAECRQALNRQFEYPIHPAALSRIILSAAQDELARDDYEDFLVAAIRENLGLLHEVSGYSPVDLIQKLDRAGIPTRTLLEAPRELLESALAQLQGRKGLNRKLDQALAASIADRAPLLAEIQQDLEDAVSVGSDLLQQKEQELGEATIQQIQLSSNLAELREAVTDLRAMVGRQTSAVDERDRELIQIRSEKKKLSLLALFGWITLMVVVTVVIIRMTIS